MNCHICYSANITYYKQRRVDGVWVVTARCENNHIPEKGHPFYSVTKFNLNTLPVLGSQTNDKQPELFSTPAKQTNAPTTLLEYVEQKRNGFGFNFKRRD